MADLETEFRLEEAAKRERMRAGLAALKQRWWQVVAGTLAGGALGFGASFAFTPRFMSTTLFIPPQQQQSSAASALASLSSLSGLVGGAGIKSSADQYISMLEGVTVSDRIIDKFGLAKVYDTDFKDETRTKLSKRVTIAAGKKDGLIRVDVEDTDPRRAAAMANQYVEELRFMTAHLAVTEAQQRRAFFERLLNDTKQKLIAAQVAVEASGFNPGALKAEPKSAAETYARIKAELTSAQVKLQVLHGSLADNSAEVIQQTNVVKALSEQVARLETSQAADHDSPDYISRYRDFKYQETLFDLYSKQYELARLDESREGAMIQVVDEAQPAERRMFPRRSIFARLGLALGALVAGGLLWRRGATSAPSQA